MSGMRDLALTLVCLGSSAPRFFPHRILYECNPGSSVPSGQCSELRLRRARSEGGVCNAP